jgi:hypothetical protein
MLTPALQFAFGEIVIWPPAQVVLGAPHEHAAQVRSSEMPVSMTVLVVYGPEGQLTLPD